MRICLIEGCENKHEAKGYCVKHYSRLRKYGDPLFTKKGRDEEKHGMRNSSEYRAWRHMNDRCYNKKHKRFHRYGGRGIIVCNRWKNSFLAFFKDMGKRPFPKAQIDRKDNDGNYTPENCQWATPAKNTQNSINSKLTMGKAQEIRNIYKYEEITYRKLAAIYKVTHPTIGRVIKNKGWVI